MKGGENVNKFLGLGLVNLVGIWLLFTLMSVAAKTIAINYPIEGVSDIFLCG